MSGKDFYLNVPMDYNYCSKGTQLNHHYFTRKIQMNKITFQIFDQGLDISINNNHYSLCDIKDLQKQKNSTKFKQIVLNNYQNPNTFKIVFENICKTSDFQSKVNYILSWVGVS